MNIQYILVFEVEVKKGQKKWLDWVLD